MVDAVDAGTAPVPEDDARVDPQVQPGGRALHRVAAGVL
jgi:hypothetical protein